MTSGLALAAVLFHLLRIRPALEMQSDPVGPDVIRAHLGWLE